MDDKTNEEATEVDDSNTDEKGSEFTPAHVLEGGYDYRVDGNDASGYIGVSPEYQTYANPLNKPMLSDAERLLHTDQYDHLIGNADDEGNLIVNDEGNGDSKIDENETQNDREKDQPDAESMIDGAPSETNPAVESPTTGTDVPVVVEEEPTFNAPVEDAPVAQATNESNSLELI